MQIWQIVLVMVIVMAVIIGNLVLLRLSAKSEFKASPTSITHKKDTKKP